MRGRKRQRKKDEKRRGVWGLDVIVTPKRKRDQGAADALAKAMSHQIRENREEFFRDLVAASMKDLTPRYPNIADILKVREE